ncbi:MAG: hypothetical protein ABI432_15490 [Flavobacteriales bacterium]
MLTSTLRTTVLLSIALCAATHVQGQDLLHTLATQHPHVHVSLGGNDVIPKMPHVALSGWQTGSGYTTLGMDVLVRVERNWLVGVGYSQYAMRGGVWRTDSVHTQHFEGGNYPGWFGGWQYVAPYDVTSIWGDAVFIAHQARAVDLLGGYELRKAHTEHAVYLTGTVLTGVRAIFMEEEQGHLMHVELGTQTTFRDQVTIQRVHTMGWAWTVHLRGDVHFTSLFSLFTELVMQPLGQARMPGSTVTVGSETGTMKARIMDLTGVAVRGGVALHF